MTLQVNNSPIAQHHNNDDCIPEDTIYYDQVVQHKESLQANTVLMERLTKELKDKENKK